MDEFKTKWRSIGNGDWQLIGFGGELVCPAVLAVCGPSELQRGRFWCKVSGTPETFESEAIYKDTLQAAKNAAESHLAPYIEKMSAVNAG